MLIPNPRVFLTTTCNHPKLATKGRYRCRVFTMPTHPISTHRSSWELLLKREKRTLQMCAEKREEKGGAVRAWEGNERMTRENTGKNEGSAGTRKGNSWEGPKRQENGSELGRERSPREGTHRPLSRPTPHTRMLTMGCEWSTERSMGSTRLSMSFSSMRYMSLPWDRERERKVILQPGLSVGGPCCDLFVS